MLSVSEQKDGRNKTLNTLPWDDFELTFLLPVAHTHQNNTNTQGNAHFTWPLDDSGATIRSPSHPMLSPPSCLKSPLTCTCLCLCSLAVFSTRIALSLPSPPTKNPTYSFLKKFYWGIVDLQCCVNFCCMAKWFTYTYSFPLWFITGYWIELPVLYSRILLFIHPIYNSLQLLTPNSQSFSPRTPPTPWQPQVWSLCLWVCFCFIDRFICVAF